MERYHLDGLSQPQPREGGSTLWGVSCASAISCKAVGESFANARSGATRTLVESWNGTDWTVSASPSIGTYPTLDRVSCVSATWCVATGFYSNAAGGSGFIESWNGSVWTISTSPNTGTGDNLLLGVSCVSTTSCMAVGVYYSNGGGSIGRILTESWNGSTWRRYYAPSPLKGPFGIVGLDSVSCASATSCQAVSSYAASHQVAFIESWNGTDWTVSASPNPGTGGNSLSGVSCVSTTSCKAAGSYYNANGSGGTLIEAYG